MAYVWLQPNDTCIKIEPADLTVDQRDIVQMVTTLAELTQAGALATPTPDRATCDRLANLLMPYITGVTVEQLGAAFAIESDAIIRVLRRVLLLFLYSERPT